MYISKVKFKVNDFDSSLKVTIEGVFVHWKLVNAANMGFFFSGRLLLNIYQHNPVTYICLPLPELAQQLNLTMKIFIQGSNLKEQRGLILYLPCYFVTPKSAWKYPQISHLNVMCVTKIKLQNNQENILSLVNVTAW